MSDKELYEIRPLKWTNEGSVFGVRYDASTTFGGFSVFKRDGFGWFWEFYFSPTDCYEGSCDSLADGKMQAENEWRRRMIGNLKKIRKAK